MFVRVQELAYFLHLHYEHLTTNYEPNSMQFFDGLMSLKRLTSYDEVAAKITATDVWCTSTPSFTSKSQIICRTLGPDKQVIKIHQLSGAEMMFMIGWPKARADALLAHTNDELTAFAGGAFSGFSIIPVLTAVFYAAHVAGIKGDDTDDLTEVDHAKLSKLRKAKQTLPAPSKGKTVKGASTAASSGSTATIPKSKRAPAANRKAAAASSDSGSSATTSSSSSSSD